MRNSTQKCDVYLTLTILVLVGALGIIERLGVDRWNIVSPPTLVSIFLAGLLGFALAFVFFLCSLSIRSGNEWVTKSAPLRHTNPRLYALRVSGTLLFV